MKTERDVEEEGASAKLQVETGNELLSAACPLFLPQPGCFI